MKSTLHKILMAGLLSAALLGAAQAQEQPSVRDRADEAFQRMQYYNATQLYERLVTGKRPRTTDFERLAESYALISAYELAENWYARAAQQEDFSPEARLKYADVLKMNGRYAEAKVQYAEYEKQNGASDKITMAIAGADSAVYYLSNPSGHTLRNERAVNTDLAEFGAIPTGNGMVYAGEPKVYTEQSGMTGNAYLKVFSGSRDRTGEIRNPVVMSDVFNTAPYHVGPIATDLDETTLFVTRTHPGRDLEKYRIDGVRWRKANLELKIYRKDGASWSESDFPYNNVESYSLGHASLNDDGDVLYYASDMPGGEGGVDIWYSERQADGSWGSPQNAGPGINSPGDEMFPSALGDTLYFSSNGYAGMGGLDIYKAVGTRNTFSNRQNMGHPINSAADDFAYYSWSDDEENVYGYIASNRPGGMGSDDIYSFELLKPVYKIVLKAVTKDKESDELLSGTSVSLLDMDGEIVSKKSANASGTVEFSLDKDTPYKIHASKQGYYPDSLRVAGVLPKSDTILMAELRLQQVFERGTKFELENVYYDFDKDNIRPDAAKILDELVRVMRDNPTLRIELSSHTDSRGSDQYNMALSQRRADSAVDYLVKQGIARDRMVAKGYGETRLVNGCSNGVRCTVDQHQANRRTEIEVLEY